MNRSDLINALKDKSTLNVVSLGKKNNYFLLFL